MPLLHHGGFYALIRLLFVAFTFSTIYLVGFKLEQEQLQSLKPLSAVSENTEMSTSDYIPAKAESDSPVAEGFASEAPGTLTYHGALSRGSNWSIRWAGPGYSGVDPIDALRAMRDHLYHLQRTDYASDANAKLQVHVIKAIEEFEETPPTIGGELNQLIPE